MVGRVLLKDKALFLFKYAQHKILIVNPLWVNFRELGAAFYFSSKIKALRFGTELVLAPYAVSIKPRSL